MMANTPGEWVEGEAAMAGRQEASNGREKRRRYKRTVWWYLGVGKARHHHRHMGIIDGSGVGCHAGQIVHSSRPGAARCDAVRCGAMRREDLDGAGRTVHDSTQQNPLR